MSSLIQQGIANLLPLVILGSCMAPTRSEAIRGRSRVRDHEYGQQRSLEDMDEILIDDSKSSATPFWVFMLIAVTVVLVVIVALVIYMNKHQKDAATGFEKEDIQMPVDPTDLPDKSSESKQVASLDEVEQGTNESAGSDEDEKDVPQETSKASWAYRRGSYWEPFFMRHQVLLEEAYQKYVNNKDASSKVLIDTNEYKYQVDFKAMVQTNLQHKNKKKRKVRRQVINEDKKKDVTPENPLKLFTIFNRTHENSLMISSNVDSSLQGPVSGPVNVDNVINHYDEYCLFPNLNKDEFNGKEDDNKVGHKKIPHKVVHDDDCLPSIEFDHPIDVSDQMELGDSSNSSDDCINSEIFTMETSMTPGIPDEISEPFRTVTPTKELNRNTSVEVPIPINLESHIDGELMGLTESNKVEKKKEETPIAVKSAKTIKTGKGAGAKIGKNGKPVDTVEIPNELDVLCVIPRHLDNHPGNRRYRDVVDSYAQTYENAKSKQAKMALTKEIVSLIQTQGKFRKYLEDEGVWVEIPDNAARDKVSNALRRKAASQKRARETGKAEQAKDGPSKRQSFTRPPQGKRKKHEHPAVNEVEEASKLKAMLQEQQERFASYCQGNPGLQGALGTGFDMNPVPRFTWEWQQDSTSWCEYSLIHQSSLEQAYQLYVLSNDNPAMSKVPIQTDQWSYEVDMARMIQTNLQYRNVRFIRRRQIA